MGLHVYDREMLEQQAIRLGVPEAEVEKIDEQPAGIFQRFRPGSLYQRYFQALEQLTRELAEGGEVLLVGRGGCWFLRGLFCPSVMMMVSENALCGSRSREARTVRNCSRIAATAEESRRGAVASSQSSSKKVPRSLGVVSPENPCPRSLMSGLRFTILPASRRWSVGVSNAP